MLPFHYFVDLLITAAFWSACVADARQGRRRVGAATLMYLLWWLLIVANFNDSLNTEFVGYQAVPPAYGGLIRIYIPLAALVLYAGALVCRRTNWAMTCFLLGAGFVAVLDWFYLAFALPYNLLQTRTQFSWSDLRQVAAANGLCFAVGAALLAAYAIFGQRAAAVSGARPSDRAGDQAATDLP